ncbi:MAG: hypothetical protein KBS81_00565, partial [Spirochaetales bacterium]|nr:hypothetical protein [Candidatus Physcosoma equi]
MTDLFSGVSTISKLSRSKAEKNLRECNDYLNNDFMGIAKILMEYHPMELLRMAAWEERRVLKSGTKDSFKRAAVSLLPVLLQSILVSNLYKPTVSIPEGKELKSKDWDRVKTLCEDVMRRSLRICDCYTAFAYLEGDVTDEEIEGFWNNIYNHYIPFEENEGHLGTFVYQLRSILEEVKDLKEQIGMDFVTLSISFHSIARLGLNGIDDLAREVAQYGQEYALAEAQMTASGALAGLSEQDAFRKVTTSHHWEGRAQKLAAKRDGFDLFLAREAADLPEEAFRFFALKPGSVDLWSFLGRGEWPVVRYPFLEIGGEYYTYVGRHIMDYCCKAAGPKRRNAAMNDVLQVFFAGDGVDVYNFDGNKVDISILPSLYDVDIVREPESYRRILEKRREELAVKTLVGHKRLIIDPDQEQDLVKREDGVVFISSGFMYSSTINKVFKKQLMNSLFGELELPTQELGEAVDEDDTENSTSVAEEDNGVVINEDEMNSMDYEYSDVDEDEEAKVLDARDENLDATLVEYEKKDNSAEMKELEEKFSLTEEII